MALGVRFRLLIEGMLLLFLPTIALSAGHPLGQVGNEGACSVTPVNPALPPFPVIQGVAQALSSSAQGESEFCSSPLKAICGLPTGGISKRSWERSKEMERRHSQMLYRAHQILAEKYRIPVSRAQRRFPWSDATSADPGAQELREAYFQVQELAVQNSENVLRGWTEKIRGSLVKAMREDLTGVISPERLRALEAKVSQVRFLLPSKVFKSGMPSSVAYLEEYQAICGADGLKPNAYYLGGGNISEIVVCPGMLLANPISSREHVMHTLAHELGHALDTYATPELKSANARYLECVLWSSADQLKAGQDPQVYPGASNPRVNVHYHSRELLADYWALRVIERQVAGSEPPFSPEQALSVISKAYEHLCDTSDEGMHPSDHYRMELILGSSPALRKVFGCKGEVVPEKKACRISAN